MVLHVMLVLLGSGIVIASEILVSTPDANLGVGLGGGLLILLGLPWSLFLAYSVEDSYFFGYFLGALVNLALHVALLMFRRRQ